MNRDFKMRDRWDKQQEKREQRAIQKELKSLSLEKEKRDMFYQVVVKPTKIHGAMKYRCQHCENEWFMCLEIGVEDFGKNGREHQPCPFVIPCECGGFAQDISGYIPLPNIEDARYGIKFFAYDDSGKPDACGKMSIYLNYKQ